MSALAEFQSTYNELIMEIDILETRITDLEKERRFLVANMHANAPKLPGAVDYSKDRVQSNFVPFALDRIIERMNKIDETLGQLRDQLKAKQETMDRLDRILAQMDDLEYKVAFMRDKLHMRLQEIADKLGYSYDHIKRISSRIRKMPPKCHRQKDIRGIN
ncbi:hypothetical protein NDK47_24140 [Brevibacillus ruminantium]|uniref:Uncharacterized protein n=1 Tax=Brevibacillus ruminantium TaxID=2950604 RepID=A0ABY4WGL9_9BACL|nr:hypothetical protein [Brevibacillus ruminantium]USG65177.1 hypothetical protein NDK47_24140 [Brevibacillus ruminantium]